MKYLSRVAALAIVAVTISAVHTLAKDAPNSPDELAKRLEQAVKAKNKAAVQELFCWDGVSKDMRTLAESPVQILFDELGQGQELSGVKAGPLPSDFQLEQVLHGVKYRPNLSAMGVIRVTLDEETNPTEFDFVYGKKENAYFLSALVEAKASGKTDDKK